MSDGPGASAPLHRHPALGVAFAGSQLRVVGPPGLGLLVDADTVAILALCDGTRDLAALASDLQAAGRWPGLSPAGAQELVRTATARLGAAGAFVESGPAEPPQSTRGYAHPSIHRHMLRDQARTDAFRRALEAVVRPGDVVVDVGTGSGALAVFAAKAGAARVHAVERTGLAAVAREVAAASGVADRVVVHEGDARDLPPPGLRADVLVSEWLGHMAVTEAMLPAVAAVRDRCLAPDGVLIPARVTLWAAPMEDAALRADGPAFWLTRPYGLALDPLLRRELERQATRVERVAPAALLARPAHLETLDVRTAGAAELTFATTLAFTVERDATLDGLAGWFEAELAPDVLLDTGPDAPETHWRQHVFPLPPRPLVRGSRLEVEVECLGPTADGRWGGPSWRLRVTVDGEAGEVFEYATW